jgi:hypothetical protein
VRAAIQAFTAPGDMVLDPFVGGGTTLVEALALGRHSIGVDISTLATFISEMKTSLFTNEELSILKQWSAHAPGRVNMHSDSFYFDFYAEAGYYRHLGVPPLGAYARLSSRRSHQHCRFPNHT